MRPLHEGFIAAAAEWPHRVALRELGGAGVSYRELDRVSDSVRDALVASGVAPGDRVGLYLPKSIDAVAAILGALKAGAAYVPIDPGSPPARAAFIANNCAVRAVLADRALVASLIPELESLGPLPLVVPVDGAPAGAGVAAWVSALGRPASSTTVSPHLDEPAYLLYTSGSTGRPKGVVVSHRAAVSFVDWCSTTFRPGPDDRFSSHAPFHFDLSIHDLFVSLKHGASVTLLGEEVGKDPARLAATIAAEQMTIWYSTPSILALIEEYGHLERHDCRSLRYVLFAGEVYPIPRLRRLLARWPWARYVNLYGPTETNVCTWFEVPDPLPRERLAPLPIGRPCAHYDALVLDGDRPVAPGEEGELLISGPGIMTGYWNLPEQNTRAFHQDSAGRRWYRTGDVVSRDSGGDFVFHGRRDRMVKRRGYRIELGEIETALARHPALRAAAVVAKPDDRSGVLIHAFLVPRAAERPSLVDLKRYCVEALPRYMAPDRFTFLETIPQTSTDKTDYQRLLASA